MLMALDKQYYVIPATFSKKYAKGGDVTYTFDAVDKPIYVGNLDSFKLTGNYSVNAASGTFILENSKWTHPIPIDTYYPCITL